MQAAMFHYAQSFLSIPKQAVLLALTFLSGHPISNSDKEGADCQARINYGQALMPHILCWDLTISNPNFRTKPH